MKPTFNHPNLGTFPYRVSDDHWEAKVNMPAFAAFNFNWHNPNEPTGIEQLSLQFADDIDADEQMEAPTEGQAVLAEKVIANQDVLVPRIVKSLWRDFTGEIDSRMWWNGDLNSVKEAVNDSVDDDPPFSEPLAKAEDMFRLLSPSCIRVYAYTDYTNKSIAELKFHAAFEEEHDLDVLTDGENILGHGYATEARPF